MTQIEHDNMALNRCCGNNAEAKDWLRQWRRYVHQIDDLVDDAALRADAEFVLNTFARAAVLYTHPFFLKNIGSLRQLVLNITNTYADSVRFERLGCDWQKDWADHHRHCGSEMVLAVCMICHGGGVEGYEAARALSAEVRVLSYEEHRDDGKSV